MYENNLYYQANMILPAMQITTDGEHNVISNALPDWMYEGGYKKLICAAFAKCLLGLSFWVGMSLICYLHCS